MFCVEVSFISAESLMKETSANQTKTSAFVIRCSIFLPASGNS